MFQVHGEIIFADDVGGVVEGKLMSDVLVFSLFMY